MGQSTARHAIIAPSAYDTTPAMLDPSLLRQDPAALAERLRATRGFELDAAAVERLEAARKRIQVRTQELQNLRNTRRSEEHTSELQSLMRISYAVFCLQKKHIHVEMKLKLTTTTSRSE